jgi:nucleotide-binding universal stress UspA family protein
MTTSDSTYKWPLQFNIVATAVAFSPSAKANLFESSRIAKMLNASMILIHVGYKTPTTEQKLNELISEVGIPNEMYTISWRSGDPTDAILNACTEENVDLLIAGALQKENLAQYYKGSIARKLSRKASCSLLLLTHPEIESRQCNNVMVNGLKHPKTADTIKMAVFMANLFKSNQLTVVEEVEPKKIKNRADDDISVVKASREKASIERIEKKRLQDILQDVPMDVNLKIKDKIIFGKPGYTIGHFAEKNSVDLLVLNSPDTKLGIFDRVFTHNLEYILSDLPTDLLIVHTTKKMIHGSA